MPGRKPTFKHDEIQGYTFWKKAKEESIGTGIKRLFWNLSFSLLQRSVFRSVLVHLYKKTEPLLIHHDTNKRSLICRRSYDCSSHQTHLISIWLSLASSRWNDILQSMVQSRHELSWKKLRSNASRRCHKREYRHGLSGLSHISRRSLGWTVGMSIGKAG
jgi:hypothetical protein